jgi:hypothetical protein
MNREKMPPSGMRIDKRIRTDAMLIAGRYEK